MLQHAWGFLKSPVDIRSSTGVIALGEVLSRVGENLYKTARSGSGLVHRITLGKPISADRPSPTTYRGVAQSGRAIGSYPLGRWFNSNPRNQADLVRVVKTTVWGLKVKKTTDGSRKDGTNTHEDYSLCQKMGGSQLRSLP